MRADKSRLCTLLILMAFQFCASPTRVFAEPGVLVVHPDNPRYLMVKNDPARKAVLLAGSHTWAEFQTYREETFDYDGWLGKLTGWKHNFMRGWIWEDGFYRPLPHAEVGGKFYLTRYNSLFFDRMTDRVRRAAQQDLYVSVMLFQGWSVLGEGRGRVPPPWPHHPFHRDNNTSGIDGDPKREGNGHATHTLQIPAITRLQEAYVKHFVDELNGFDNIIWEIGNECHADSAPWQYHMVDFIKRYEATKPKQHLVWLNLGSDQIFAAECHAELVSPGGPRPYLRNPPAADGRKVVIADSDHISPLRATHEWAWKSFTRGLHPILMDCKYQDLTWWTGRDFQREHVKWQQLRDALTVIRSYANRINLVDLEPQTAASNSPSSTRYCLYEAGREYLVYQPVRETPFTVELPAGTYICEWINPVAGRTRAGTIESTDGKVSFTAPFPWPAVLYLRHAEDPAIESPESTGTGIEDRED